MPPSSWDDEPTRVEWAPPDFDATIDDSAPALETIPRPAVEVEDRRISPVGLRHAQHAYEIWTKNRVYNLDARLECMGVIDLASGQNNAQHPFLGMRLVGGQSQGEEGTELSYPLPVPGSDAVFQKMDKRGKIRLSVTSRVTRVILHVKRVKVQSQERDTAWGNITATGTNPVPPR
jgi:hypothetical protein